MLGISLPPKDEDHRPQQSAQALLDSPFPWYTIAAFHIVLFILLGSYVVSHILLKQFPITDILASFLSFHLPGFLAIVITIFLFVPQEKRKQEASFTVPFSLSLFFHAGKITLILVPLTMILAAFSMFIMQKLGMPTTEDPVIVWLQTSSVSTIILLICYAVIIAPITEELMFRLVLYKTLYPLGKFYASIFTSLLFALSHLSWERTLPLFTFALILQSVFHRSGQLWLPIAIHASFNATMILLVFLWFFYK